MIYYSETPGLYTDQINPFPFGGVTWPFLEDCGFEWASFQVYNPQLFSGVKGFDLAAVRAHGFEGVGVWGVIYDQSDFYNGGKQIGAQALGLDADHCIVDAEMCLKETLPTRKAKDIIRGIRDGGWKGPVDLSTLGAPWNPTVNDYNMDTQSFLETGGSVHSQDYFNESEGYTPANGKTYWTRVGVPFNKLNSTIGLYPGARGKITGTQWVKLLQEGGFGRNFSVYMVQDGTKADYEALSVQAKASIPIKPLDSTGTKNSMIALADSWLHSQPIAQTKSRIRLAKRILQSNDTQLKAIKDEVYNTLNSAGVPQ